MLSLHEPVNQRNQYQWPRFFSKINTNQYDIWGSAGSGNTGIAQRVLYQISRKQYSRVIVVWSGVNRLDIPVSKDYHLTLPKVNDTEYQYNYFTDLDDTVWYHCGGYFGPENSSMPKEMRAMFRTQFLGMNRRMLTDLTLSNVIMLQSVLSQQQIPYSMSWMYDPRYPYTESHIEPGCGQLDETSPLMNLVDWTRIDPQTAYEWAQRKQMMYNDGFHWSWDGGRQWLLEVMNEDIFQS